MKTNHPSSANQRTSICRNCERELALDFFYVNKNTQCPDKYCKECRKSLSRSRYSSAKRIKAIPAEKLPYPIITEIEDRKERMRLIQHALQEVQLSIERRKVKEREEELIRTASEV